MFAPEGVASVGLLYAPVIAALCGVLIGFGNMASAGLRSRFVLISGAMIAVTLRDVPLSVAILTNGYGLLLLLWLFAPELRVSDRRSTNAAPATPAFQASFSTAAFRTLRRREYKQNRLTGTARAR